MLEKMSAEDSDNSSILGKRSREDRMSGGLSATAPHETLWFEDGNIVLIAEDVAFKVHKSVLARQSPVFCDMFGFPQPNCEEVFDGTLAVRLHDQAADVAIFIEVMYDGFKYRRSNSWDVLQPLLLLSNKYGAEDIRREALFQLERIFPKTVEEWDLRMDHTNKDGVIHTTYDPSRDCIGAVNVARTLDIPALRSAALYDCCQQRGQVLVMGIQREGKKVDRLCEEDLALCFRAVTHLIQVKHYMMNKIGRLSSRGCRTHSDCAVGRAAYLSRINDPKDSKYCIAPSVMDRADWLEDLLASLGMCPFCIRTARRAQQEARRVFLERIHTLAFLEDIG